METRRREFGSGWWLLWALAALGLVLALWRFANGIASVSNLNQGYPWGFWIGFDILAGIALAAGGFVVAGFVHIFGARRYHALVRPAILTAFLGYLLFITALLVDLGRPWTIWHLIVFWHHESPMFEVGWCVMLYTTVLFLEFLPALFDRFGMAAARERWRALCPWLSIAMLLLFTIALTQSVWWVCLIAVVLLGFEVLARSGLIERDPQAPTLLIMAGIIFSTLHQSSLGTLFLMVPHKLSHIWYTPILPVLFFVSAVMTGLAMIIIESTFSARYFGHRLELDLLRGVSNGLVWVMALYLLLKVSDIVLRGAVEEVLSFTPQAIAFWIEMWVGLLLPLAILMTREAASSEAGIFWSSVLVAAGLVINRLNVAVTGIKAEYWATYYPHWMEIAISLGIVAAGVIAYGLACRYLPIFEAEHAAADW